MLEKIKEHQVLPEAIIFGFAFLARFIRLGYPHNFIFDEVYHAFTAQEMLKGNPAAWEWWNTPPPGVAYEWTHPPLAKEFMEIGMLIFGNNAFGWRFFSAIFGFGIIVLIYFIARKLFNNRLIGLLAAFTASLDGLLLTMSRIAMNDSYFVFFSLLALVCLLYNKKLFMSVALGLALASKWTGFFGIAIAGILLLTMLLIQLKNNVITKKRFAVELILSPLYLIIIPLAIYIGSYTPFFLGHHSPPDEHKTNWQTFIGLQQQMWWYHTGLKATHDYQSKPWQWVFDLRPVWFYVDYKETTIANIYNLGNPLYMWFGAVSILFVVWDFILKRSMSLATIIVGYFGFFLPWVDSPRIMFFYHYTPAVPFLALAIGYVLHEFLQDKFGRNFVAVFCILLFGLFLYFYPLWTAIHVPKEFYNTYFWFKSWK